jgi:hypothetical protein
MVELYACSDVVLMLLYLLQEKPEDIASIVVSSGLPSAKRWIKEAPEFKALLPIEMQHALSEVDVTGDYDKPEVQAAAQEFYRRHVCSLAGISRYRQEKL